MAAHTMHIGDARDVLKRLPAKSAQLVVTSPPYWCIKDYEHPLQLGHQDSYSEYLDGLGEVWREAARVLEPGCKLAVNVGDQFLRAADHGVYRIAPIHADITMQVQALRGFIFLGGIIWRKITTTKTTGGCTWMGSIYYPRDGYVTYEHEFILLFKKTGRARRPSSEAKELSKLTKAQRSQWFRGIWDIPPARQSDGHPATFPVELPERLIRMFTYHGETVLDPFAGSGTSLVAAERSGRRGVGIELNPTYVDLCRGRIADLRVEERTAANGRKPERGPAELRREQTQPQSAVGARTSDRQHRATPAK